MLRQGGAGGGAARLALERFGDGSRNARPALGLALVLARLIGIFGALAGALLGLAFARRRKVDAGAPRLGKSDRNRLLR